MTLGMSGVCPCSSPCHFMDGVRHAAACCDHCGQRWTVLGWEERGDDAEDQ